MQCHVSPLIRQLLIHSTPNSGRVLVGEGRGGVRNGSTWHCFLLHQLDIRVIAVALNYFAVVPALHQFPALKLVAANNEGR